MPNLCSRREAHRRTTRHGRDGRYLLVFAVTVLTTGLAASCGSGSEASSQLSSTGAAGSPASPVTNERDDPPAGDDPAYSQTDDGQTDDSPADGDESPYGADDDPTGADVEAATGIAIDPSWQPLLEPRFVSRAPLGAIVTLYAEPSNDAASVGSVRAAEVGLTLFDVTEEVDGRVWSPVKTADGVVGWIKNNLLRPEPSVSPPERIGDSPLRGSDTIRLAVAGLSAPEILADQIDERGLTMSATAFVDDEAVVLTAEQLRTAAEDATVITWGVEAGVGDPITATITERFKTLAGSTAITSTEATGFDVQVGVGNIPSNVAETFPGAQWVELHFSGTEAFGGLDWESMTFVFDTTGDTPVLLAITQGSWSP